MGGHHRNVYLDGPQCTSMRKNKNSSAENLHVLDKVLVMATDLGH